jgi:L-2-hydroxyglutarate oxidase LhgO
VSARDTADFDLAVIGAGVVGLAIAERATRDGQSVLVLDRAGSFGTEMSSRNSEVIHAGLYYPPGSLKARLCNQGRAQLYAFCEAHGVAHRRCGKLIVATGPEEEAALERIAANARAAGGGALDLLSGAEARALEPALSATAALWSGETGVVDSHGFMASLTGLIADRGGQTVFHCEVTGIARAAAGWGLAVADTDGIAATARSVVIAAGLGTHGLAATIDGFPTLPPLRYAKGNYFGYAGRVPFERLIYPVPVPGGLGTHLTLDLAGRARFGPDVEWVEAPDHAVSPGRVDEVAASVRRFWPGIESERLYADYCGIRPKLTGPDDPAGDFRSFGPEEHGLAGLVALFGIESPGLTASLALADHVAAQLARDEG